MKKHTSLATAVAVSLTMMGSGLCHAQDAEAANPQKRFNKLDTDKNGSINLDEFKAGLKDPSTADKKFARIDANKDGGLSLEEFAAKPNKKAPASGAQGGSSNE